MKSAKTILSIFVLLATVAACNNVDFKKTRAGVPYKIFSDKKGDSIKLDHIVKFQVIQKIKDSVLFSTYDVGQAQYMQVRAQMAPPNYNDIRSNIQEILIRARNGDSVYMVQATDSMINQNPEAASQFKKGDLVVTTLKIEAVYKTPEEADSLIKQEMIANADVRDMANLEKFKKDTSAMAQMERDGKIIEEYLNANNIKTTKTNWGAYMQVIEPGQGPKPKAGQYVEVRYKGMTLDGEKFDEGIYPVQMGMGGVVKGFEEGIRQLSLGGKGKVFIPSILGYGVRGKAPDIQPNENLVFELEILNISNTPPAQIANPADTSHAGHGHD